MKNFEYKCYDVIALVKETGAIITRALNEKQKLEISEKGVHDFVTQVDKQAEERLINGLSRILPGSGFLAEENTGNIPDREFMWIVDPLDGTTNFIHSVPLYSISVALMLQNQPVIGVVYEINLDECFYSWQNGCAYLNKNKIQVSSISNLSRSLFGTGFPYYNYDRLESYMGLFMQMLKTTSGLRRLGSAAVDLAWVACGRLEGFFEYGLHPWDVAAGAFIVQQAGGVVCDFKGENDYLYGKEIVASNKVIHEEFMNHVKIYFS